LVVTLYKTPDGKDVPGPDEIAYSRRRMIKKEKKRLRDLKHGYKETGNIHYRAKSFEDEAIEDALNNEISTSDAEIPPLPQFLYPQSLDVNPVNGMIYISDSVSHRIYSFERSTQNLMILAGSLYGHMDGYGTKARFGRPSGICACADGHVFVMDIASFSYRRIDPKGYVTSVGNLGRTAGTTEFINSANMNEFYSPCAAALAEKERLLIICDPSNHELRHVRLPRVKKTKPREGMKDVATLEMLESMREAETDEVSDKESHAVNFDDKFYFKQGYGTL